MKERSEGSIALVLGVRVADARKTPGNENGKKKLGSHKECDFYVPPQLKQT